jgi:hypothetical protein
LSDVFYLKTIILSFFFLNCIRNLKYNENMKKLFFIVSLLALSLGCLTSCNDSEKPSADYEWDFNVSDIVLHVTSQEGTNLLDAGVAGNILENDIRIEYAGEVYPLADETGRGGQPESDVPATRMLLPAWNGLSLGMTDDCGPCLKFGEFGPTKMYKNECFTLDLGTGRTWNISFDFWVDGINTDNPVVHSSLYVDGEKMDFPLAEIRLD